MKNKKLKAIVLCDDIEELNGSCLTKIIGGIGTYMVALADADEI